MHRPGPGAPRGYTDVLYAGLVCHGVVCVSMVWYGRLGAGNQISIKGRIVHLATDLNRGVREFRNFTNCLNL